MCRMVMFHDDDCGAMLELSRRCPKYGFAPDMQSCGLRRPDTIGEWARAMWLWIWGRRSLRHER
jgi:hypothetical protein